MTRPISRPGRSGRPRAGEAAAEPLPIAERLRQQSAQLTKSERRLARILFSSNMMAGFDTVVELARKAGVSGPTVLRFTAKLGCRSYPEFQRTLREELEARLSSPLSLFERTEPVADRGDPLTAAARHFVRGIEATLRADQSAEFDAIVEWLRSPKYRIHLLGGRFTRMLAEIVWGQMYQLRPGVSLVPESSLLFEAAALDMGRRDVLVVFDVRRYQRDTAAFARLVQEQGAKIVLITDVWLSPIAEFADHLLTCDVEYPSPFDSLVPCLALTEVLLGAVTARVEKQGRSRVARLEAVRARLAGRPQQ